MKFNKKRVELLKILLADFGFVMRSVSEIDVPQIMANRSLVGSGFYRVVWIGSGDAIVEVEGSMYNIQPNTIVVVRPDQVTYLHALNIRSGMAVGFTEDFLFGEIRSGDVLLENKILDKASQGPCYQIKEEAVPEIELLLEKMKEEFMRPSGVYEHRKALSLLLQLFLISIRRNTVYDECDSQETALSSGSLLVLFKKQVELHYHEKYPLSQYASNLSVSESILYRTIKNSTDKTPNQIISERRVVEAKRLLVYTSKTISEIAFAIGNMDQSNFHKFFLKHTGMTPKSYREKGRKGL